MAILEPMGAPTPPQDSTIGTITKRTRSPSNGDKPVRDKLKKTSISVKPLPVTTSPGEPDSSYAEEVQPTTPTTDTQKSGQEVTQQIDPATKQTAEQTVDRRHTRKRSREHSALDIEQISASRVIRPRREGRSPSPILEETIPDDHPPSNMKESSRSTTPDTSIDGSTPPSKINSANDSDTKSNAANQSDAIFGKTELAEADEKTKSRPTTPSPTAGHPSPRETTNTNDKPTTPPPVLERQAKRTEVEAASVSSPKASGTTAFASSGLSAFASSSASPFGKITSGKGASAAAFSKPESIITPSSTFGSPKAAGGSAFGGFGAASTGASIFGSPFGKSTKGPGLTSFASGKPAPLGKPEKPFGAPASESEGEEDGDEDESLDEHATNSDVRFTRKDTVETGEEGEQTFFSCRSKMYQYEDGTNGKKEWKEKGVGTLKLNTTAEMTDDGQDVVRDAPYQCRLLLRTDGVHRLILNQSLVKGLKFGDENGDRPTKKQFLLIVSPSILLSIGAAGQAGELYDKIKFLLDPSEPFP